MRKFSAAYLAVAMVATISTMWLQMKWATTIPEVATCLLAVLWAGVLLAGWFRPHWSFGLLPLGAVVLLCALQILLGITIYPQLTTLAMLYWAGNLAVFFSALQIFADLDLRELSLKVLVFFGTAVSVFATIQALTSHDLIYWVFPSGYDLDRVFGPFVYRNQYAAFLELIIPIALYFAVRGRRVRFPYLAMTGIMYCSVITCGSRTGFFLASAELVAVPMLAARRRKISSVQIGSAALVAVAMLLWLALPEGSDTLIGGLSAKDPFAGRREFDISSLAMIKAKPVTGFGLWTWSTAYPGYATFDDGKFANQAHNDWAQWTVEGGFPLLAIMLSLAVWAAFRAIRTAWGIGVLMVFLHCAVDYPIQRTGVAIVFFILMAAIARPNPPRLLRDSPG